MIEDEAGGYFWESPLHRGMAGADLLKALHSVVQVVFTQVEVSSDLDGVSSGLLSGSACSSCGCLGGEEV